MKIAVATMGHEVSGHFGHCEKFTFITVENGEVKAVEEVMNPGHKPGFLPNFLADRGIDAIISGGMGAGAVENFNTRNIEVIMGASGDPVEAAKALERGALKSTGSICHKHEHAHECGGHHHE